jgi:hypothetical protein
MRGRALLVLLALALVVPAGCGPQIPKTYPVKGKLRLTGGKLAKGSTITFQSESVKNPDGSSVAADGAIQDDGTFTVTTKMYGKSKPGAVEGEHNVLISEPNTVGADGQLAYMPIIAKQKAKVEAKDNELTIDAVKPVPVKVRGDFARDTVR